MKIILAGANGAMGHTLSALAPKRGVSVVAGFDTQTIPTRFGYNIYAQFSQIVEQADVLVDFSHFTALQAVGEYCVRNNLPLVSAITGLSEEEEEYLVKISSSTAVFRSANFSLGISLLKKLTQISSGLLSGSFDIEIVESHHNRKIDSPSGTAHLLAQSVIDGSQEELNLLYGRALSKDNKRAKGDVAIHSIRGGSIVGSHEVIFAGEGELLKLTHHALSREVFASGALSACEFMAGKQNGYFTMDDIVSEKLRDI
ncbi:MAG: 4-hydroxy-tetrahydrodipicolinate reductase [Eubacteriaceae bacterium]|nr:4-hydroxy-tetrahydrodipicolinate reductase [Eubacteriaceae bacterium]